MDCVNDEYVFYGRIFKCTSFSVTLCNADMYETSQIAQLPQINTGYRSACLCSWDNFPLI